LGFCDLQPTLITAHKNTTALIIFTVIAIRGLGHERVKHASSFNHQPATLSSNELLAQVDMSFISFGESPKCCHCHTRNSSPTVDQCGYQHKTYPKTKYPHQAQPQGLNLRAMHLPFTTSLELVYSIIWLCKRICEFYLYLILFATTLGARLFRRLLHLALSSVDNCLLRIFDFSLWGVDQLRALSSETPTRQVRCGCNSTSADKPWRQGPLIVKMPQTSRGILVEHVGGERASEDYTEDQARELVNCIQLRDIEKEEVGGLEPLLFDPLLESTTGSAEGSNPTEIRTAAETEAITQINDCTFCAKSGSQCLHDKTREEMNNDQGLDTGNLPVEQPTTQQLSIRPEGPPSSSISPGCTTRAPTAHCNFSQPIDIRILSAPGSTSRNKLRKHRIQPCTRCSACARRQSVGQTRLPRKVSRPELPRQASLDSSAFGNDPYSKATRWVKKYGMRRPGSDAFN
jgi:hypothetical protein